MSCFLCASVVFSLPAQAKMYKWKDENGQTQYGDRVPDKYLNVERKELNSQGTVVDKVDRAMTAEERNEKRRQEAVLKEELKVQEEQKRQDRVLLDTYTTERDLVIARDARIDAVNSQINLSESIIESAKQKLERTEKQITNIKARNREVPKAIHDKLEREQQELETHKKVASGHQKKSDAIQKQFGGYIARFNELKQIKADRRKAAKERRKANGY